MTWQTREKSGRREPIAQRRSVDRTDYEHRYFVNLVATAFILALAVAIGWTVKAFDRQLTLEKCLDSGRKECRQITEASRKGVLIVRNF